MITDLRTIRAGAPKTITPIELAILCYRTWKGEDFRKDLRNHLLNGVVIVRPDLFAMASIIDLRPLDADGDPIGEQPEPAWFVRMAVGELGRLLRALPCYLPKICFCRRNDGRLRVYDTARLFKRAVKIETEEGKD